MQFKKVLWGFLVVFIVLSLALPAKAKIEQEVVKEKLKGIPVPFVENKGQINSERVKFYAKTLGGTLFVEEDGTLTYNLPAKDGKGVAIKEVLKKPSLPRPGKETITKVNYFIGKDKNQWRTGISTYESVIIKSPFAGINLTLKAYGKNVEKIFQVTPKAKPEGIRIKIQGTKGLRINATGELELITELGSVKFTKPLAYQKIRGEKREIEVSYVLYNKDSYGFKVAAYDRNHDLFIDPLLASTYVGGSGNDSAYALALDSSGNVYVAGYTDSSDFPTTPGAYDRTYNSGDYMGGDAFISKFNSSLSSLLASTYVGGSGNDSALALALDSSGNVYVAGYTDSSDYPTTPGAYDRTYNSGDYMGGNAFISKFNSGLSRLLASTYVGGSNSDSAHALALDSSGNVYVAGVTYSSDYPTTPGAYERTYNSGDYMGGDAFISKFNKNASCFLHLTPHSGDAFISKFNSGLSRLLASTYVGGSYSDGANALAMDSSGNVYVAGVTCSSDYPTTPGAYDRTYNSGDYMGGDAFISKLNSGLSSLLASTYIGGSNSDSAHALALDSSGNVYVAGCTYSSDYPTTPGAYDGTYNDGYYDVFISKFNSRLSRLLASTYIGGSNSDGANALALDSSGNVYVAGCTLLPVPECLPYDYCFASDAFISKFNSRLSRLLASTYVGGSGNDSAYALALDSSGNVYVAGRTYSSDFPTTPGAYDETHNSGDSVFISKLDSNLSVFPDVSSDHWAFKYIQKLRESGITTGYPNGTYRLENNVTRAEIAAFLIRATIGDDFTYEEAPYFPDVSSDHWAFKYIQKLRESGITTGYPDGTYRLGNNVTRAEIAAFLIRALEGEPADNYCAGGSSFPDVPPDSWSCKYIKRLSELSITTGYPDGTYYRPYNNVTMEEMAAFLARAFLGLE